MVSLCCGFGNQITLRAFTIETSIFGYLNVSHVYTSFIYNFFIVIPNKHSFPPTLHPTQISKMGPTN